jgi:VIT1/CCC1 family predicted Fe2+/Mn2+ transporter
MGIAAGGRSRGEILLAGVASLVAGRHVDGRRRVRVGAVAGDSEEADLALERRELKVPPEARARGARRHLRRRGLDRPLAREVAEKLTARDALAVTPRDEIGITDQMRARPVQAAVASAASFAAGGGRAQSWRLARGRRGGDRDGRRPHDHRDPRTARRARRLGGRRAAPSAAPCA